MVREALDLGIAHFLKLCRNMLCGLDFLEAQFRVLVAPSALFHNVIQCLFSQFFIVHNIPPISEEASPKSNHHI